MRMATIREFRSGLAEMTGGSEPLLVTRNGKPTGVFIPWNENADLPLELKREAFKNVGNELGRMMSKVDEKELLGDFRSYRKSHRR